MHHNFASSRTHQHQTNEELQTAEELCCYHGARSNVKLVLPVLISGLLLLTVVITARVVDSSTGHQSGKCEHDWEPHGKQCYFFSKRALNWSQSLEECTRMRSHLVIIDNEDEQLKLNYFLCFKDIFDGEIKQKMQHAEDKFWIGLNDIYKEGKWQWVDNTPLNTNQQFWTRMQPDDWKGKWNVYPKGEDCVRMGKIDFDGKDATGWCDAMCHRRMKFICET